MKIRISLRNIDADSSIVDYIERRVDFTFGRIRNAIQNATVTLSDVNGPKGGIDKQCRILIKPEGLPSIVVTDDQLNLREAIDSCLSRASHNLTRKLKKKQLSLKGKTHRMQQTKVLLSNDLVPSM